MDNANYLFKNMPRFAKKDYIPSFDDICFSRVMWSKYIILYYIINIWI